MLVGSLLWALSGVFGVSGYHWLVRKYPTSFMSKNFKGSLIPSSAGICVILASYMAYSSLWVGRLVSRSHLVLIALTLVLGFGLLGLADDLLGDRSIGGLRGHFNELIRRRRLTTGAAKAIGGVIVSIVSGVYLYPRNPAAAVIAALVIALCANVVNLTDTRPGRSLAVYLALNIIAGIIGFRLLNSAAYFTFIAPLIMASFLFIGDRSGNLMIGDAGANALGALAGLLWAVYTPTWAQIVFLSLLLLFHWWTESHSLSKKIEQTKWMKWIDCRIGVRD